VLTGRFTVRLIVVVRVVVRLTVVVRVKVLGGGGGGFFGGGAACNASVSENETTVATAAIFVAAWMSDLMCNDVPKTSLVTAITRKQILLAAVRTLCHFAPCARAGAVAPKRDPD
jgi:hypothetical protein